MRTRTAIARTTALAASALLAVTTLTAAGPAAAAAPAGAAHRTPGQVLTIRLHDAIDALPVADETRDGYERTKFRHWTNADKNGCNTRKEVILAEAVDAPDVGPGCAITGGAWFSPYDDLAVVDSGALDVDHMVPLAEAWDSGAFAWSPKEREAYANDLGDPRSLIAVSARSNRSKADKDVADWMPPAAHYACTYLTDWTTVKTRWSLTADPREKTALTRLAATCADEPITVELAR
ncbi:HNH endonuclease family protein [Kitasatospora purpeofusca]|uniref:HNH endonuclease family protein n=1 Tax=Kitasatospora purpeofusca TaxID=67352 RepID=UPI0022599B8D|nr:HNH endonuclease family protein [Kitasatospora purpeofusca]MCX4682713.1 HNH endonuclease family protein [Kitasatospora purpeofusca]MCX4690623.1 HNH endonuclease family protein [Kitasatospora purpeofusca]MCX4690805.1 HNH endonuclease family protein [Kitasatospora purpeofusca]